MRTSLLAVAPFLIAFAACNAVMVTGCSGGSGGSGGNGGAAGGPTGTAPSSSGSTSSSSSSGSSSVSSECPNGGYPCVFCAWSPGLACSQPGVCCYEPSCTDNMMPPFFWYECTDAGTWASVQ